MKIPTITLPEGFTSEAYRDYGTIITLPDAGGCTLDWKRRDWRPGFNTHVPQSFPAKYSGRDWAQRMANDAAALLTEIKKEIEGKRAKAASL